MNLEDLVKTYKKQHPMRKHPLTGGMEEEEEAAREKR
jgi:hypothetical protein